MATAPSYIFGGTTGETPESIRQKRQIADMLLGQTGGAKNWGEGFNSIAKGLVSRWTRDEADSDQAKGNEGVEKFRNMILGGSAPSPAPGTGAPASGEPANWLNYDNAGATRNQPLAPELVNALSFLPELGVSMDVFSGGQDAEGPNRVGSHRHDGGNAGDVFFSKDGRRLDWNNPDDLPIYEEIVRRGKAAGVTGFGAGEGYMQPGSMHLGFGAPAVWGAGGSGGNAPDWLRNAFAGGAQPTQVASLDPSMGAPQKTGQLPPQSAPAPAMPQQAAAPETGQGGADLSLEQLLAWSGDPFVMERFGPAINSMIQQKMQQQDPRYLQQLRAGDLGIQKSEFELNQMLNPGSAKPDYGFVTMPDGTLVRTDATSGGINPMGQFGKPEDGLTDTQRNLSWRAEQAGLTAGTPEYAEFMRSGGQSTGMALTVGPDGTVQFAQGAGVSGKPLTESQSKDTVYVTRAQGALPLLDQYGGALTDYRTEVTKDFPLFGNATKSPEYQQAEQAGLEFLQAVLRKDTGAAITPDETAEYGKVYLPRPGDSPQVLEQKRMSRARAVAAIEAGMPPEAILAAEKAALASPNSAPNAAGGIDDLLEKYQ